MRRIAMLLVVLCAAAPTAAADTGRHWRTPAGVEVGEYRHHYVVDALNSRDLVAQLREGVKAEGKPPGRTRQSLEVQYRLVPQPGGCRLEDLQIRLDVHIHLPAWVPAGVAVRGLETRWLAMLAGLTRHEEGHRDNALRAADELLLALASLPAQPDCRRLQRAVDRTRFQAETRYRMRDQSYDRRTRHGINQGSQL
jgi:predicted secreted Zn-dependent protease